MPVIGYLSSRTADTDASMLASVRRGLADVGYAEGRNVGIEYRFADGRYERENDHANFALRRIGQLVGQAGGFDSFEELVQY
jgi:putative ABC transport system substrate-binding protein